MPEGSEINTTSDENSMWLRVPIPDMTDLANRVHNLIVALDIHELENIINQPAATGFTRAGWNKPRELKLKYPVKVLNVQE